MSTFDDVQRLRVSRFASALVVLSEQTATQHERLSIFSLGLNNALLAIAADLGFGGAQNGSSRTLSASALLDELERRDIDGIDFRLLREAKEIADAPRHGRGAAGDDIADKHVQALSSLGAISALANFNQAIIDIASLRESQMDADRRGQAIGVLKLLNDDEIIRREESAEDSAWSDPGEPQVTLEECPVCLRESLVPIETFEFGHGQPFSSGSCVVCGYFRSEDVADSEARSSALWAAVLDTT